MIVPEGLRMMPLQLPNFALISLETRDYKKDKFGNEIQVS